MNQTIRALRHLALSAASLLTSSCVMQPNPSSYSQTDLDGAGYYDEQAAPAEGYYAPPGPRPYGVVAPGYYRPQPGYRGAPYPAGAYRSDPFRPGGTLIVRGHDGDRDDDHDRNKSKGKHPVEASHSHSGPPGQGNMGRPGGSPGAGPSMSRGGRDDDDDHKHKSHGSKKDDDDKKKHH